jgi:histidinol-phosphate/aromatic aminotransferase/cobyric acid decarboxylase-like protein
VSQVLQHMVLQMSADADTSRLMDTARRAYIRRREGFLAELAARGVTATGRSGFNVLVPVPEEAAALRQLQDRGWVLRAGEPHRLASPPFVRVTISTLEPPEAAALADDVARTLNPARHSHHA